jgi:beta-glucosidase
MTPESARDGADGFGDAALAAEVDSIISDLSLEEKVYMMSGHDFFARFFGEDNRQFGLRAYQAGGGNERLGLDPVRFTDGPRGVRIGPSTCFPVVMARGATWDTALEERIGEVIGIEGRANGATLVGAVCINLLRHPAWGRAQETYGEDPYLLGELGAALSTGIQKHNLMATVKHFAVNSIENSRFKVNVVLSERTLREVYLPHFKRVIDAGCATVMSAYNKVNGSYCGHNRHLQRDILKNEWGFRGFVHSDWVKGVYGADAAEAGLDIENPEAIFFGKNLIRAVEAGDVSVAAINDAVRRILETQLAFAQREDARDYAPSDLACPDHTALAREAAEKSITLLENRDDLLPLDRQAVKRLLVVGELADTENLGDHGSSRVRPPYAVTPLEGLRAGAGDDIEITHLDGKDVAEAERAAKDADAVLVVAGYTYLDEGEYIPGNEAMEGLDSDDEMGFVGGDRQRLTLREEEEELISRLSAKNPRTIVALMAGSAVICENWRQQIGALLMLWYPGMEGGNALASVLFGDVNPSGKLPFTMPRSEAQLPFFDCDADEIHYDYYHGYTKFEKEALEPAYPFGFGLSYTRFRYDGIRVEVSDDTATVYATIHNAGERTGTDVAQLYLGVDGSAVDRPRKLLRGFNRVTLAAGESREISFPVRRADMAWYDESLPGWQVETADYTAYVGNSSAAAEALSATIRWPA